MGQKAGVGLVQAHTAGLEGDDHGGQALGQLVDQLAAIMEAPYDEIVKCRRIGSEELVDEQLALAELSVEMAPKDARDVWAYFGNEDVEQIPEMTTAEFLAVAQRR